MKGVTRMTALNLFALKKPAKKLPAIEEQIRERGLPAPETEYPFAAAIGRKWKFDYAWPEHRLAFEVEGGGFGRYIVITSGYERKKGQSIPLKPGTVIRVGGRHNTGEGMQKDLEKYNRAAILGWMVVRGTTTTIRDGLAIVDLVDAFLAKGVQPCLI